MEAFIAALRAALPGLRLRLAGMSGAPHLAGAPYQAALGQCALGLNASRRNDMPLYSSDRLAQMIGSGQVALVDRAAGYNQLFSDNEMGFFASVEELVALIRGLLADRGRRQRIAAAGRARYHALFNETVVARYIVEVAFGTHDPGRYEWPTLVD
jgi:hypothetical protein